MERGFTGDIMIWLEVTLFLGGAGAFATGRALAESWQPAWRLPFYMGLLAAVADFLCWALFGVPVIGLSRILSHAVAGDVAGVLEALEGFGATLAILLEISGLAYVSTRRRQMRRQYPFLFVPASGEPEMKEF